MEFLPTYLLASVPSISIIQHVIFGSKLGCQFVRTKLGHDVMLNIPIIQVQVSLRRDVNHPYMMKLLFMGLDYWCTFSFEHHHWGLVGFRKKYNATTSLNSPPPHPQNKQHSRGAYLKAFPRFHESWFVSTVDRSWHKAFTQKRWPVGWREMGFWNDIFCASLKYPMLPITMLEMDSWLNVVICRSYLIYWYINHIEERTVSLWFIRSGHKRKHD